jgi:hypothetical protein
MAETAHTHRYGAGLSGEFQRARNGFQRRRCLKWGHEEPSFSRWAKDRLWSDLSRSIVFARTTGIGAQLTLSESRLSDGFAPIPAIRVTATELVISTMNPTFMAAPVDSRGGPEADVRTGC